MASSRVTGTSEDVSTYNSAGGADYSDVGVWESATDIDLPTNMTSPVLEVQAHGSQLHDDDANLLGETSSATYFRIVRAAAGARHNGIPTDDGSQAGFEKGTGYTAGGVFLLNEDHQSIQDLVLKRTANEATTRHTLDCRDANARVIGIIIYDSLNNGTGNVNGIRLSGGAAESSFAIDCLVFNLDGDGIQVANIGNAYIYNCTIVDCDDDGIDINSGVTADIKNCLLDNTNNLENSGTINETTNFKGSFTFVDEANDNFRLPANDTNAKGQGTDLSADANFAFDDDLDRRTRNNWDIGAFRYQYLNAINGVAADTIDDMNAVDGGSIDDINGA